jgi:Lrp/AsnC family transcriptional regulator, leucine-responsive regulatory protein
LRLHALRRYDRAVARAALDETDHAILGLLTEDARLPASEIGRRVSLSSAAASRRIARLEELGIIAGYRAVLDHGRLGTTIEAFVELRFDAGTQVDDIETAFAGLPELVEGFTVAGDPDALVRLRVGNLDHLKRVIDRIRRARGVASTKTLIVLGTTPGTS